jgi:hypothetical protein
MSERFDFDQLAQDMARGLSRREALQRLGAGFGGALLASLGFGALRPEPAEATTPANLTICFGACGQAASSCGQQCGQNAQSALAQVEQAYQACLGHCAPGVGYLRCAAVCQATRTQQSQLVLQQQAHCNRDCLVTRAVCVHGCTANGDAIVAFCSHLPAAEQSGCISSGAMGVGLYQACGGDATRLCPQPAGSFVCCAQSSSCCSGQCCDSYSLCQDGACVECPNGGFACGDRCCGAPLFCAAIQDGVGTCACNQAAFPPDSFGLACGSVCCDGSARICQDGECVGCPVGQSACADRCCPENSSCTLNGDPSEGPITGTCT